ncbi:MAG: Leucine-responsive regulatory protein, regulator for leucine (or lrp) regulon and high-affinity branched-chain amino acid transport system, partial [uncultured Thermoleophilia bacterium]
GRRSRGGCGEPPPAHTAAGRRPAVARRARAPGGAVVAGGGRAPRAPGGHRRHHGLPRPRRPEGPRVRPERRHPRPPRAGPAAERRRPLPPDDRGGVVPAHHRRGLLRHGRRGPRRAAPGGGDRPLRRARPDHELDRAVLPRAPARTGARGRRV